MKFVVDFQAADESGALTTSFEDILEGSTLSVFEGANVLLDDDEGHSAWGTVVSVIGDLVDVRISWVSWRDRRFFAQIPTNFEGGAGLQAESTSEGVNVELAARL
jgi:hypothetical protein